MVIPEIKYNEKGLVPAIAQDSKTGDVLMMAWMNEEALSLTLSTGKAHYYSRSRGKLWLKGETSGNIQKVHSVKYDCDADTILLGVTSRGTPVEISRPLDEADLRIAVKKAGGIWRPRQKRNPRCRRMRA